MQRSRAERSAAEHSSVTTFPSFLWEGTMNSKPEPVRGHRERQEPSPATQERLDKLHETIRAAGTPGRDGSYYGKVPLNKHPFVPGADIGTDDGEIRTEPWDRGDGPPPDSDVLEQFDLDPQVWEVVSRRKSLWQQRENGPWLEAHRVSVRRRTSFRMALESGEMDALLQPYMTLASGATPSRSTGSGPIMAVPIGDLQVGKIDGGGTPLLLDRFGELTAQVAETIAREGKLEKLLLPWLGDCLEGVVSQGGRLATRLDLSVTEQLRVYRRLMMHQIGVLAPLADEVIVVPIAGNHDETTRQFKMPADDSWALEGASAVSDALAQNPAYEHVHFRFPDQGEITTALNVGTEEEPFVIAATHGHVMGSSPNMATKWWAGQAHGRQPAGEADLLMTGHWHHMRVEFTGGGRTWLQVPAMDGGSLWYEQKTGDDPPSGMVTMKLTPGVGCGWSELTVHSRAELS